METVGCLAALTDELRRRANHASAPGILRAIDVLRSALAEVEDPAARRQP